MTHIITDPGHIRLDLGGGHYMVGTAEVETTTGVAKLHIDMTCTNKLFGFTGGAFMVYTDAAGNSVGKSDHGQWGIDQAPLIGASHRSVEIYDHAPATTAAVHLVQYPDPKSRLGPILQGVEDVIKKVGDFLNWWKQFQHDNPVAAKDISVSQ